jgi:hypothetical protein
MEGFFMEQVLVLLAKLPEYLGMLNAVLLPLIAFFMVIPGDQPEKALKAIVDVIAKYSKK